MDIYFVDRKTGERVKEVVAGETFLRWVYHTKVGSHLLEILVKKKLFTSFYGRLQDYPFSSRKIKTFVEKLSIDMTEAEEENIENYRTFNDFFARRLKPEARPICMEENVLISPADGRLLAYENIDIYQVIQVKGSYYSLVDFFQDQQLAEEYQGGTCIVVRLCPADYHRFHFPDGGLAGEPRKIEGHYYSVNPLALQKVVGVYCQNKREITLLQSKYFDQIAFIEVGATCVGSIVQTYLPNRPVKKGEEKGYFKFGGSTVVLFLKKGAVQMDEDLIRNTEKGLETKVNMGERIGKK